MATYRNQCQVGLNLRALTRDGEPWFIAKDVCDALALQNPTMVLQGIHEADKAKFNLGLRGHAPWLVNESGLYDMILNSRKPDAKAFRRWITNEVLPTIRKTGMYLTPKVAKEVVERPEVFLARALVLAHDTINNLKVWTWRGLTVHDDCSD